MVAKLSDFVVALEPFRDHLAKPGIQAQSLLGSITSECLVEGLGYVNFDGAAVLVSQGS